MILDDIPITTEERFRCRNASRSNEHPKDYSSITIRLSNVDNVPSPTIVSNNTEVSLHQFSFFKSNMILYLF